jgi:hypothetical protein
MKSFTTPDFGQHTKQLPEKIKDSVLNLLRLREHYKQVFKFLQPIFTMTSNVLLFYAYADNKLERWQEAIGLAVQFKNDTWGEICGVDNETLHIQFVSLIGNKPVIQSAKFKIKDFVEHIQDMDIPATLESSAKNIDFHLLLELKIKEIQDSKQKERLRLEAERSEKERRLEEEYQKRVCRQAKKTALFNNLKQHFEQDFLNTYNFYQAKCTEDISLSEYKAEKLNYVQSWVNQHFSYKLDIEQVAAIAAFEGHAQVIARAGSGKISTLVNRALFLQKHCGVAPDEILLLAFNRKAAEEIRERLTSKLKSSIPHVMTFHALAYALVHPEESILFDEPDGEQNKSRIVQDDVINKYIRDKALDPAFHEEIRALMMVIVII